MVATDNGNLRVRMTDANRGIMTKVFESRTEPLNVATDPRQQLIVPMSGSMVGQDDLVILEVKVDTTSSMDYGLSTVRIPITVLATATGQKTATYLVHADFTTDDVTLTAGTWVEVGAYEIPAQQKLKLGHEIPDNSRVYIDMVENA